MCPPSRFPSPKFARCDRSARKSARATCSGAPLGSAQEAATKPSIIEEQRLSRDGLNSNHSCHHYCLLAQKGKLFTYRKPLGKCVWRWEIGQVRNISGGLHPLRIYFNCPLGEALKIITLGSNTEPLISNYFPGWIMRH
jgi:hypothetical protein